MCIPHCEYITGVVAIEKLSFRSPLIKVGQLIHYLVWSSSRDSVICLHLQTPENFVRLIFQDGFWFVLIQVDGIFLLTKRLKKKLDGNYTRMLRTILNKSWWQHPTRHQLYGHLPPITKTIQVRRTRHAGHCWRSKDELISDVLLWTPHMANQKQDDQLEHTYSSYVRTRDVTLKTSQKRWMIGRSSERGSGISVLAGRHDDDNDDD